jgi:hypothetical protein
MMNRDRAVTTCSARRIGRDAIPPGGFKRAKVRLSTLLAMAADCEISDCGVAAMGRCPKCNKAFCFSHKWGHGEYTICSECGAKRDAPAKAQAALRWAVEKFISSGEARKLLVTANVPSVNLVFREWKWDRGSWLRRSKSIETDIDRGVGWHLGSFEWEIDLGSLYQTCPTVLMSGFDTREDIIWLVGGTDDKPNNVTWGGGLGGGSRTLHSPLIDVANRIKVMCGDTNLFEMPPSGSLF